MAKNPEATGLEELINSYTEAYLETHAGGTQGTLLQFPRHPRRIAPPAPCSAWP
jgi:hypothetical protein